MPLIQLLCAGCGFGFEKPSSEIKRQQRKNPDRKFYCSISCYAHYKGKQNLGASLGLGRPELLTPGKTTDKYSPFRYFMRKARNREHNETTDLDLLYLKTLWEQQGGCCALSGLHMELPRHAVAWGERLRDPWKPSLDRIDCSIGYLKGNVRFVTVIANLAKQNFSDEQLLEFCRAVVQHNTTGLSTPYQRPERPSKVKEARGLWQVSLVS
jgi:hypothetical protein